MSAHNYAADPLFNVDALLALAGADAWPEAMTPGEMDPEEEGDLVAVGAYVALVTDDMRARRGKVA